MVTTHSQNKEPATKVNILGLFYRFPIKTLPVVDKDKKIIGLLHKEDLIASATVANLNLPLKQVIKEHLVQVNVEKDYRAFQTLLINFKKLDTLPVIDIQGKVVDYWKKFDLISNWENCPTLAQKEWECLFNAFPYPVIIVDKSAKIDYLNPQAEGLIITGRGRKILGKSISQFIDGLSCVETLPLINKDLWIEGEAFCYDGIAIFKNGHRTGTIYLLRRMEE